MNKAKQFALIAQSNIVFHKCGRNKSMLEFLFTSGEMQAEEAGPP